MGSHCAQWLEAVCLTRSAERRAPSAEAMTAPWAREQSDPPSPPDTPPPRRGGGSSSHTNAVSANGPARSSGHGALRRAAAALLVLLAATAASAPAAHAQEATALQATMTVGLFSQDVGGGYLTQHLGYHQLNSAGNLSPMQFEYPASSAAAATYTVLELYVLREGNPSTTPGIEVFDLTFTVHGAATSGTAEGGTRVLPKDVDFTLHLAGNDWSKSYSLKNADSREFTATPQNQLSWLVGDAINEWFVWTSDFPPLVDGETVTVRLTYVPPPPAPADLVASHGDGEVALSWAAPGSGVTRHEYRYRTTGSYPDEWAEIDDSGAGGANASGFTVTGLDNGTAYTFEVRAVASGAGAASEAEPVTPNPPPVAFTSCMPNPGDVWCGAVTVGRVATTKGRTLKRGFHATWHAGQNSDGVGELPDRRFVYGPNSYRIDEVTVGAGNMAGFLFLSLNRPLPAAVRARLVLHVGGKRFLLSEAHHAGRTDTYHWRETGLDWSSTTSATLRLRADLPAAPTGLAAEAPSNTGGLLKLSWTAPAPGVPITGYEVKYWEADVAEDRRFRHPAHRERGHEHAALSLPGREHRVQAAGAGEERHRRR